MINDDLIDNHINLIKNKFIDSFSLTPNSDYINNLINDFIIPNFDVIACDLDLLIDQINDKNNLSFQSLDFIELVFNPNLYQTILEKINTDCLKHYMIIFIELVKYQRYVSLSNKLLNLNTLDNELDNKIKNTIFFEGLTNASDEKIQMCINKIKSTYKNLIVKFPNFETSKMAINMLLASNNLVNLIYEN